ncbi:glutamate-rich protein 2-like [Adelges cooleyi]|uniref:glutamate-rich protein 2-like n=1 Tax=Adelges cooleyi TaxID=133065 RepID=UPI00217FF1F6|nr:glutamate-rich protein 2-like [Adelges cooleyi]
MYKKRKRQKRLTTNVQDHQQHDENDDDSEDEKEDEQNFVNNDKNDSVPPLDHLSDFARPWVYDNWKIKQILQKFKTGFPDKEKAEMMYQFGIQIQELRSKTNVQDDQQHGENDDSEAAKEDEENFVNHDENDSIPPSDHLSDFASPWD